MGEPMTDTKLEDLLDAIDAVLPNTAAKIERRWQRKHGKMRLSFEEFKRVKRLRAASEAGRFDEELDRQNETFRRTGRFL